MESNKLNNLIHSDLINISTDILEIPLDKFIDDDTIKSFPILGVIFKTFDIGKSLNDKIFANKLIHFLNELKDLDSELILKEIRYLDDSKKYNQKVGEKVLELISRIDSDQKPKIVGRLFKNFLLKKIKYEEFLKFSYIVETIFVYDLNILKDSFIYNVPININIKKEIIRCIGEKRNITKELISFGICEDLNADKFPFTTREFANKNVKLTTLGNNLYEYGLKK